MKAAASCYIDLIVKESDNNVKLIVLDRLVAMKDSPAHEKILQELVMDILRVLSSPDLEVRRKTLALAMDLVTSRNIDELVLVLKKVRHTCAIIFLTCRKHKRVFPSNANFFTECRMKYTRLIQVIG